MAIQIEGLLKAAVHQQASDIHLVVGAPPALRVHGRIIRVKAAALTPDDTRRCCYSLLTDHQKSVFEKNKELDFSFSVGEVARFRGNAFFQQGVVSAVFRRLELQVPPLSKLNLPEAVHNIANYPNGLVLVTGPTGSGKSTTIAAVIDQINRKSYSHILTLEDPVEYIHSHKRSLVNQREIGSDTASFLSGIKYALRQDPDVCFVGEMRDKETIDAALILAETGHLVFGTLHTNSVESTISRVLGVFEGTEKAQIQSQLSMVLRAVVSQKLIPSVTGRRVVACEALFLNTSVKNLIREGKLHQVYGMMQVGQEQTGNITMNQSLFYLVTNRKIDVKYAFENSLDPEGLDKMLQKAGL